MVVADSVVTRIVEPKKIPEPEESPKKMPEPAERPEKTPEPVESPKPATVKAKPKLKPKLRPKFSSKASDQKKVTTIIMVQEAIFHLTTNSRKSASLYAIKKHLLETHKLDTGKISFLIKRAIKSGIESGRIIQTKGSGANGSFRIVSKNVLGKIKKPHKKMKGKRDVEKGDAGPEKKRVKKQDTLKGEKKTKKKAVKKVGEKKAAVEKKKRADAKKISKTKEEKAVKTKKAPAKKTKKKAEKVTTNATKTKKAKVTKRKSVGSILKPPQMKPKSKKAA